MSLDSRQKRDLDNHITGHYGEDQFRDSEDYIPISESVIERIAVACKKLEDDMWMRLKRHADIADLKVVIRREMEK